MTKNDLVKKVLARQTWQDPAVVKRAVLVTLDELADDLRQAMFKGSRTAVLTHRDMHPDILLRAGEVRAQLSRSIIFKAALAELVFKKPGRKKLPLSQLKKR
jgi:hypothetical protein